MQKKKFKWIVILPLLIILAFILALIIHTVFNRQAPQRERVKIYTNGNLLTDSYETFKEFSQDITVKDNDGMPNYINAEDTSVGEITNGKEKNYIGNKNSKIYHLPSCTSADKTKDENKVYFSSKSDCENSGYKPCSRCNP